MTEKQTDMQTDKQTENQPDSRHDLEHFLKLAAAQVRHRMKSTEPQDSQTARSLQLLEDLIKEQGQTNENSRSAASPTR